MILNKHNAKYNCCWFTILFENSGTAGSLPVPVVINLGEFAGRFSDFYTTYFVYLYPPLLLPGARILMLAS
jgi:hypothetical protein